MRRILLILLLLLSSLLISNPINSQTIVKVGMSKSIIQNKFIPSVDIGQIVYENYYSIADVCLPLYNNGPGYLNIGFGPIIGKKLYTIGVIGFYSPNNGFLLLNAGAELGIIWKDIVTSVSCTNNYVSFKIGYKIKEGND